MAEGEAMQRRLLDGRRSPASPPGLQTDWPSPFVSLPPIDPPPTQSAGLPLPRGIRATWPNARSYAGA
jgi:hypothetical protein